MASDMIKDLLDADKVYDERIDDAKQRARLIIENAERLAGEKSEKIIAEANEKARRIIDEANVNAKKQASAIENGGYAQSESGAKTDIDAVHYRAAVKAAADIIVR